MKDIIKEMDKAFDSRVRLGIMALLLKREWIDFNSLKQILGVTDGNLASHTASLERKGFIEIHKKFIAKRPNTSYRITESGKTAFTKYTKALKLLLGITQSEQ